MRFGSVWWLFAFLLYIYWLNSFDCLSLLCGRLIAMETILRLILCRNDSAVALKYKYRKNVSTQQKTFKCFIKISKNNSEL